MCSPNHNFPPSPTTTPIHKSSVSKRFGFTLTENSATKDCGIIGAQYSFNLFRANSKILFLAFFPHIYYFFFIRVQNKL